MKAYSAIAIAAVMILLPLETISAFTISVSGDNASSGQRPLSEGCQLYGEEAFTSDSGNTRYTDEQVYSGDGALKLTIEQGSKGFGSLGGIIDFASCDHVGGRILKKGDEVWVRVHVFFPKNFEFNRNGRNKFLRLRTFSGSGNSEGYNDLYLDGRLDSTPYDYIFEGVQRWYAMGEQEQLFPLGQWRTVEYYLRLDNRTESQGGSARVRVWIDGELIGDTGERANLLTPDSYIESLYFFTYWDNDGAHITQSFYVDDLVVTSDTPENRDANGFPFIGLGKPTNGSGSGDSGDAPRPLPPVLTVD
ncbi:hypothetical protein [Marinobacter algicola]|uniref:hypothetical protein n=1 Tax=Marinobacter algicola TaxID=236100 RepID=UPI003BA98AE6